jgi:murein DD-endopeptidase MepM/ murein hydrolase activator NlpD
MNEMPLLGRARRRPRRRGLLLLLVLLVAGGFAAWWFLVRAREPEPVASAPEVSAAAATPAPAVAAATPDAAPPAADDPVRRAGMRYVRAVVEGPLETAFVKSAGRDLGAPLTQVVNRTLVWWAAIPEDLRRGDVVEALLTEQPGAEPLVHAVRFTSAKMAKTYEAYRFHAPGAKFARTFTRDAQELELRLENAPLDEYEQVTSLLRDGRGHRGVDFRAPVGSPVKATFDAVITRKNWNFRSNGNCIELKEQGGARRTAYFLHLSEIPPDVKVGDRVARGQVVARSGNTGRSFAPHLHYQLESPSGQILDPFEVHATVRRGVPEAQRAAFDAEVQRLEGLLEAGRSRASD